MRKADKKKTADRARFRKRVIRLQQRVSKERGEHVPIADVPASELGPVIEKAERDGIDLNLRDFAEIVESVEETQ